MYLVARRRKLAFSGGTIPMGHVPLKALGSCSKVVPHNNQPFSTSGGSAMGFFERYDARQPAEEGPNVIYFQNRIRRWHTFRDIAVSAGESRRRGRGGPFPESIVLYMFLLISTRPTLGGVITMRSPRGRFLVNCRNRF